MDPVPARWPFALITCEAQEYPALVIEWVKHATEWTGLEWNARCVYYRDGQIVDTLIPASRITRVGG